MSTGHDADGGPAELIAMPDVIHSGTLQHYIDGVQDPIFFKDLKHRWVAFNQAFCSLLGRPAAEIAGKSDPDFFPPDQVAVFWEHDDRVFSTGKGDLNEEHVTRADGSERVLWTRKTPVYDRGMAIMGLCGIIMDITEQQEHVRAVARLEADAARQRAVIEAQKQTIDALVVPVLEVWEGILLLPLVGALSHGRAEHAVDSALRAVGQHRTETVIIDVTGASTLDSEVADLLVRAMRAFGLLGCRSILVGVSPASAKTLVSEGTDLGSTRTCTTVKQGLTLAISLSERRSSPTRR